MRSPYRGPTRHRPGRRLLAQARSLPAVPSARVSGLLDRCPLFRRAVQRARPRIFRAAFIAACPSAPQWGQVKTWRRRVPRCPHQKDWQTTARRHQRPPVHQVLAAFLPPLAEARVPQRHVFMDRLPALGEQPLAAPRVALKAPRLARRSWLVSRSPGGQHVR